MSERQDCSNVYMKGKILA